jgi:Transposase DDE domain group 1
LTKCIQERFSFVVHFSRRVEAGFTAGQVSSDGGALLLREVQRRVRLLERLSSCFTWPLAAEGRAAIIRDALAMHLRVGLGYEDLNDHGQLRSDCMRRSRNRPRCAAGATLRGETKVALRHFS